MNYYNQRDYRDIHSYNDPVRVLVMEKLLTGLLIAAALTTFVVFSDSVFLVFFGILAFVGEIIAIIGYFFAKKESTIEKLYYLFVASTSILLGFTLDFVIAGYSNGIQIIAYTFSATGMIVGFAYYKATTTKADLFSLSRRIMPFSVAFIILIIVGFFIPFSNFFQFLISIFGAILFSFYLYFDLQRLMQGQLRSPARMAWNLYWDILLIFKYLLRIILVLTGERR